MAEEEKGREGGSGVWDGDWDRSQGEEERDREGEEDKRSIRSSDRDERRFEVKEGLEGFGG
jgi:hypothetical protein